MKKIIVREYARLTVDPIDAHSMDRAQVSATAFEWLCSLGSTFSAGGAQLVEVENRRWLRLDNYVGVIETPCGTSIEILPKIAEGPQSQESSRRLLVRMIRAAMDLPVREAGEASLDRFDAPLTEWVIDQFLVELDRVIKRGIRFDYKRIQGEECYLRGQLDVVRQMRQPPGRQHLFHLRQDVFLPDRAENRLLRLALDWVANATQSARNWRLAQELRHFLRDVPCSARIADDFHAWQVDRLMAHYQPLRPWCELILHRQLPLSLSGGWHGISLLFPMEKLFERYVAAWLAKALAPDASLRRQASSQYLCLHDGGQMFRLEPDLLVEQGDCRWVLDTKWKRLDDEKSNKYGLSQGDFYQLFAYGHRYLAAAGDLFLIYPRTAKFDRPPPVFDFHNGLRLWVVPFDLDAARIDPAHLVGLPLRKYPPDQQDEAVALVLRQAEVLSHELAA